MEFQKKRFENGLIVLFEKRSLPITTIVIASRYGSGYESEKLKGVAHFIEHMLFKGTKKRSQYEIVSEIEKVGGEINAFTAREVTAFHAKIPSAYFDKGFDVLSDLFFNPLFNKEEMEKERKVILEEAKMHHDIPQYHVMNKIKEMLYKKPFSLSGIGTAESINTIKRNNLFDYHQHYHSSPVLVVVGNTSFNSVLEFARGFKIKKEKMELKPEIIKINKEEIEKRKGIDQAHVVLATHMPSLMQKGRYEAEIINAVLGFGMSSRLWQEIREKRGLAYSVKSIIEQEKNYGNLLLYIGTEGKNIKKVKEIAIKEIKKLQQLKNKEVEEAKEQLIGKYSLDNEESIWTAEMLLLNEIAGNAEEFYKYPERISAVKLEDVRRLAKIKNYSFFALVPEK